MLHQTQLLDAKEAMRTMVIMGYPFKRYLKNTERKNMIQNAIKAAHNIFGPDVPSLKGETVIQKPSRVIMQYVAIPRQI